jgi:hypothetical protein
MGCALIDSSMSFPTAAKRPIGKPGAVGPWPLSLDSRQTFGLPGMTSMRAKQSTRLRKRVLTKGPLGAITATLYSRFGAGASE